ncbi:MAG: hypothetical protein Q8O88_00130 [bacterium]|nr:hypothetical protein [bacterium]
MAGYVMKMSNLVSNINQCGQKDFSFKVRHKVYARPESTTAIKWLNAVSKMIVGLSESLYRQGL